MPSAGSGLDQSLLGTVKRADGSTQVTYAGHPLYYYSGDASPGTALGQGMSAFGAEWYVLNAKGSKIDEELVTAGRRGAGRPCPGVTAG